MKSDILFLLASLLLASLVGVWGYDHQSSDYYQKMKGDLYTEDDINRIRLSFNAKLAKLKTKEELAVNQTVMSAKLAEFYQGFESPSSFLSAQNFVDVRKQIKKSPVFKIIKKMPKGALLHVHDVTLTSFKYVFNNITYRPNLYISDVDGILKFKFMDQSSYAYDSQWLLLSDVRNNDHNGEIDQRITNQLTLITDETRRFLPKIESRNNLLSYRPVFEDYFYQGLLELYKDNIFYVEMRSELSPLYDLAGKIYGPLEVANILKELSDRFISNNPQFLGVKLMYQIRRDKGSAALDQDIAVAQEAITKLPGFVIGVGLDLSNSEGEKAIPISDMEKKLTSAFKEEQLISTYTGKLVRNGGQIEDNAVDAVLLSSKRIGGGHSLARHPSLVNMARKKGLALELLPLSDQAHGLVKDLRNHGASSLFGYDFPIVVASGNPGLWGAKGLSYDFYETFMGIMSVTADLRDLKNLAINSIEFSAMKDAEKEQVLEIWEQQWNQFVVELLASTEDEYYK